MATTEFYPDLQARSIAQAADPTSSSDWLSTVSSVVSAFVAVVTLVTVYLAALQILSRRQQYRLGISTRSLGPWKAEVVSPSLLKMQTQIATPTISLPRLVQKNWQPNLTFPTGFESKPKVLDPEAPKTLAEASWVNFLQCLGLTPEHEEYYELQAESELVNGFVPMRWKGPDLVAIGSMLGFQSQENEPSFRKPMPLPMQWSGPLGWLQFRTSSDGCIAEFRRRRNLENQLPSDIHEYYDNLSISPRQLCLKAWLWQSINGFYLSGDRLLYLGGADKPGQRSRKRGNQPRTLEEVCYQVMELDSNVDEIKTMIWGGKSKQPDPVRSAAAEKGLSRSDLESLPEFLRGVSGKTNTKGSRTVSKLDPCPGLLSVVVEGEWTNSRGLNLEHSQVCEFDREYIEREEIDPKTHPYNLGGLFMEEGLLTLLKDAILRLKPDGYYFIPTQNLCSDVFDIYTHVDKLSDKIDCVISKEAIEEWQRITTNSNKELFQAMKLCNAFQDIKTRARASYTIRDMMIVAKASASLHRIVTSAPQGSEAPGTDLVWALIASPKLSTDMLKLLNNNPMIHALLAATVESENGWLNCTSMTGVDFMVGRYQVPLIANRTFSGAQMIAAVLDLFLTYFWIDKKWITDVAMYDVTVPQSIIMC
ncbi:hypothetical protein FN846DRAFT_820084 [Sphaerosporella brunnea]|uniref:Uncharacterized protein n=1 Tax=Sphaerosporella brunnea TaxID=1250544 RepID=A0A5J5EGA3_9PEZI|nr:hypothetical protein FN846DRAFT_820084 [Sphaerosporella brunnea]